MKKHYLKDKLDDLVEKELHKLFMREYGFGIKENFLLKENRTFYDFIDCYGLSENSGFFYKHEGLSRRISIVEDLWSDLKPKINIRDRINIESVRITIFHAFPAIIEQPYYDKIFRGIKCEATDEGIYQYIGIIKEYFEKHIFPTANKYKDIREIDKLINSTNDFPKSGLLSTDGGIMRRIIIARLANNSRLDEIVGFHNESFNQNIHLVEEDKIPYWTTYLEVFNTVYERIKKIEPLKNPILD